MMLSRREFLMSGAAAFAVASLPLAAFAQSPAPDPVAVLKDIYAGLGKPREKHPFSRKLMGLHNAAMARSRRIKEPVAGIDFDYAVNGQDYEDDTAKSVQYTMLSQTASKAVVKVTFNNGGDQELRYEFVREGGRWLIDDVRNVKDDPWYLSDLYKLGASAPASR